MKAVETRTIWVSPTGLVTRKAAAEALVRSPKTLCEWAAKGVGPVPIMVGGRVFYRWSEIQAFAGGSG